jgi:hypothetical protein
MRPLSRPARAVALAGITLVAAATPALAQQAPPGNNGHIFVGEYELDGSNGNDPHVSCGLTVSFFGYDAGEQSATITLTPWAPTDGGAPFTERTSWTTAERTSGNQRNADVQIAPSKVADAFAGVEAAQQGWHAKIEVHVTGSQGADVKHKVVWIEPCPEAATAAGGSNEAPVSAPTPNGASAGAGTADQGDVLSAGETAGAGSVAPAAAAAAITAVPTTAG